MAENFDLIISGARAVLADGEVHAADLGIADGRIAAIEAAGSLHGKGCAELDARGLTILPGVIDAHIHLGHGEDITRPRSKEDAQTETGSAALGGVTTFLSYLISDRPYLQGDFDEILRLTAEGSRIDFSFHPVISTEEQLDEIDRFVAEYGVTSFKLFMYNRGGEGKRLGLPDIDDGFLFRLLERTAEKNALLCPHCENVEVNWVLRDRLMQADPEGLGGLAAWDASRPPLLEAEAVHRVATLARMAGADVHMVHCSSGAGLEAATAQRRLGARMSVETCTQYLTHTVETDQGLKAKVNPPIRHAADVEALWEGIRDGEIDTVATDHVHRPANAKTGGIWKASPGFPGMATLLPVMISEGYHKRGIPLGRIARLLSGNPARIMGLANKGEIATGKDADLALVDLDAEWNVREDDLGSGAGFSIYDGWQFRGKVIHTLAGGSFALRDSELVPDQIGKGQFVRRQREV